MPVTTYPSPDKVGSARFGAVSSPDSPNGAAAILKKVGKSCSSPWVKELAQTSESGNSSQQSSGVPGNTAASPSQAPFFKPSRGTGDPPRDDKKIDLEKSRLLSHGISSSAGEGKSKIATFQNGFVHGLLQAFANDLHLVLRPDDVWLAILAQFSNYVNGNAEQMRSYFVAHEGKMKLILDARPTPLGEIDFVKVAQAMADMIHQNVKDPELKAWMLPSFSTTEQHDSNVASFLMMGSLQQYFEYMFICGCGLPSVTLLGERDDWVQLQQRVKKLETFGKDLAGWAKLLGAVVQNMILTFDEPESARVKDFWMRIAHEEGREGSGMGIKTLSGWITAFAFWDDKGKQVQKLEDNVVIRRIGIDEFKNRKPLTLDGVRFPMIRSAMVPEGIVTVPIRGKDLASGTDRLITVLVGLVGLEVDSKYTTVRPASGWWVIEEGSIPSGGPEPEESVVGGSTTDGSVAPGIEPFSDNAEMIDIDDVEAANRSDTDSSGSWV